MAKLLLLPLGKLYGRPPGGHVLWKPMMTPDQTVWVTHANAHGKASSPWTASENRASNRACTSTLTYWAQNKELHVSDAEATAACRLVSPREGTYMTWALAPPVPGRWTILDLWAPCGPTPGASLLLTFFQVTILLFQSDQLSPNKSVWPLKLICHVIRFPDHLQADNKASFVAKATYNGLIVRVFNQFFHSPTIHGHLVLWGLTSLLKNRL